MSIELAKRCESIVAAIQHYFNRNMPEPVDNQPASHLMNFFAEELGRAIYDRAAAQTQAHTPHLIGEIDSTVSIDGLQCE